MHLFRAASLTGFDSIARSLGLNTNSLLREARLPRNCLDLKNIDDYLPLSGYERLITITEKMSGNHNLAARLGSQQELSTLLGVLGFVMQQSSTVGEAFYELAHFLSFQLQGATLSIEANKDQMSIALSFAHPEELPGTRHTAEFSMAAVVVIMQTFCGASWKPIHLQFTHDMPPQAHKLKHYYHAPIMFNQVQNAIVFASSDFDVEIATANPQLVNVLHQQLLLLNEQYQDDFVSQVRVLIKQALNSGSCNADKVADMLGMHRRTLHRKLKNEGTSFSELFEEVRLHTALRLLKSKVSITLLADMLCYSDLSSFSRAFKSWTGKTPKEHRMQA